MGTETELYLIKDYVQDVLQTIANIIEIQTSIVDRNFMEISGTGFMKNFADKPTPDWGIMYKTVVTGQVYFVTEPRASKDCAGCANIEICKETASVSYPIVSGQKILGAIGLNCKTENEKKLLLSKKDQFLDFLSKLAELITAKLHEEKYIHGIEKQNTNLKNILTDVPAAKPVSFDQLIGVNPFFQKTIELGRSVAKKDVDILIQGESGTGKEPFARSIHNASPRCNGPFIAVNCGAIPADLLESELFGYEKGAFTGALKDGKIGKFEQAHSGTLFLDEIGDMPYPLQVKILRVIEERCLERVGATQPIEIDIRIVSATNKNLADLIKENLFREDLYYRLNVIPITLLPLRERRDDIEPLCKYFLARYNSLYHTHIDSIEATALSFLKNYDWPGNIRELENCMKYLCCTAQEKIDLNALIDAPMLASNQKKNHQVYSVDLACQEEIVPLSQIEKIAIQFAVRKFGHTTEGKRKAAEALGISKSSLYRKLSEY